VNPGDEIYAEAWYDFSRQTGYLYLANTTYNKGGPVIDAIVTEPMPRGVNYFSADSAEWILERPTKPDGSFTLLAPLWRRLEGLRDHVLGLGI
jgi:hypothetical protein